MERKKIGKLGQVEEFRARDGRLIGLLVKGNFTDYESFPPFVHTESEVEHINQAYQVSDPLKERYTKAHVTADELPLQIVVLAREQGSRVKPHYHRNDEQPSTPTRHQIMICQSGAARIGLYTKEAEHVADVLIRRDDLILMCEGHSIEFVEPGTKLIEIKMGPFPGTDAADKVDLPID
ncbi:MAG: hypothetical protein IMW86_01890 [Hydrogenibacillus sp.]|nr:hypothetical protein [Hydrogenibacillus sp.]